MSKKTWIVCGLISWLSLTSQIAHGFEFYDLKKQVDDFDARYKLEDPFTKLVDNEGNGYNALYGTRNTRAVLKGVYYRGGANNAYNKYGKRSNMNPLPTMGLTDLCREGFTDAVYLYSDHYSTAPHTVSCKTNEYGDAATLQYHQISALTGGNEHALLKLINDHIDGTRPGAIYDHCWNGWHASGYVAAIALRQFCGWSGAQAVSYWIKNTDGNSAGHASIINQIQNFKRYSDLTISAADAQLICP